jgi:hypothetical protein
VRQAVDAHEHHGEQPDSDWVSAEREWAKAFHTTLEDAIAHLQTLIFDEAWDEIRAATGSNEAALRESARLYERSLTDMFTFIRVAGVPDGPVGWSQFKAELRRASIETETEITLRTALDGALYAAESAPLGDHALYRDWVRVLTLFLLATAEGHPTRLGADADEGTRLLWAYEMLSALEDHAAFHDAIVRYVTTADMRGSLLRTPEEIVSHQERLLDAPRFDLVLNTSLRWLAEATLP